ncbi:hypothetical protein NRB20_52270 [Nocardia sp. RB20]|uniref:Uncharacterized protein n=2 Tax=Nocardia macrotermitis TaxID=2585198 RepID=A0A7K0DB69_9NOCA|nr:hypothetical protein [Nocardia macrotermitis]
MGKPAVVGVPELTIDATTIRIGRHVIPEGTLIAIDGTGGEITTGTQSSEPPPARTYTAYSNGPTR